jgi:hypothetical protein
MSRGTHDRILVSQIRDSPNLEGKLPVFISLLSQGGPVIPPGTGFPVSRLLRLAERGGGIRTSLHVGSTPHSRKCIAIKFQHGRHRSKEFYCTSVYSCGWVVALVLKTQLGPLYRP